MENKQVEQSFYMLETILGKIKNHPYDDEKYLHIIKYIDSYFESINSNIKKKHIIIFRKWLRKHRIYSIKKSILFMLACIGYDVSLSYKNSKYFNLLLINYHNHYIQSKYRSKAKIIRYLEIHFLSLLLNK